MVSLHEEQQQANGRWKERQGTEGTHSSEPQKAYPTSECTALFEL